MEREEHIRKLLEVMDDISSRISDEIWLKHYDNFDTHLKYLLVMFDDAYRSVMVFCYSVSKVALSQAGDLLRKLIEQVAIINVLTESPDKLPKFVEHYKLRKELWDKSKHEQINIISERYGVQNDPRALTYLDYGWVNSRCNETQLLLEAGFQEFIPWKKMFLDKFVHSSFSSIDLIGEKGNFPIIGNFMEIGCKCFDYLCCHFHKLTNCDFVFDGKGLFQEVFRPLYQTFKVTD